MNTKPNLFSPLSIETAPEASRPLLEKVQKTFKFIPNLFGVFANSPALLEGYLGLSDTFDAGSLSAVERHIVFLSASLENSCNYCTAAHSTVLKGFMHVPAEVVAAIRANAPLSDSKLNALVALTKEMVGNRGHVKDQTIENFVAAGYRKEQILEVLIGVTLKTISNYTNHISPVELDKEFSSER
jgi:uncharacterized peroxidase-related enzyme